ncbi:MAG: hypothetical protein ABSA47_14595 [Verrucomicrobiota bacterium]|jgi:hypothetical protein
MKCYEEVIDFIASGPSPGAVAAFHLSDAGNQRAELLVRREKGGELTASEKSELDHYLELEHIMRLAKARARQRSPHEHFLPTCGRVDRADERGGSGHRPHSAVQ